MTKRMIISCHPRRFAKKRGMSAKVFMSEKYCLKWNNDFCECKDTIFFWNTSNDYPVLKNIYLQRLRLAVLSPEVLRPSTKPKIPGMSTKNSRKTSMIKMSCHPRILAKNIGNNTVVDILMRGYGFDGLNEVVKLGIISQILSIFVV